MEREYGIGRIPRDVDPVTETLAELEAAEMDTKRARPARRCQMCGRPADMAACLGPACADHFDDLSG